MPDSGQYGLLGTTLRKVRRLWADIGLADDNLADIAPDLPKDDLNAVRERMQACLDGKGGEVSARGRAAALGEAYLRLNDTGKKRFLSLIAEEFGPDINAVSLAIAAYQSCDAADRAEAEANLRDALRAPRFRLLTQFNALPQGVKFLVDMRADLLRFKEGNAALKTLDAELKDLLVSWFDIGFLELHQLSWDSPAALLEKVIQYEAVHEIRSWDDLRNRLESDRRLFAYFHPRMPEEPLIFVEVALVEGLARNIQHLLDESAPLTDPAAADTAVFYSISNTQRGLRGISFGHFLIKRVVESLQQELPGLRRFVTLSPLPGFLDWLSSAIGDGAADLLSQDDRRKLGAVLGKRFGKGDLGRVIRDVGWVDNPELAETLKRPMLKLAARYLTAEKRGMMPLDPVARFHLGNGARVEQLNWLSDTSEKGLKQSAGMMVNYLYDLDEIEDNHEFFAEDGRIAISGSIKSLMP